MVFDSDKLRFMSLDSFAKDYLEVCNERFQNLEHNILKLEKLNPVTPKEVEGREEFREIYSQLHSIKGTSGSHGLNGLSVVAHHFEDALEDYLGGTIGAVPVNKWIEYLDLLGSTAEDYFNGSSDDDVLQQTQLKLPSTQKEKLKILVVENTNVIYKQYKAIAEELHCGISRCEGGLDAFNRLMKEKFDILISAGNTGIMDGESLISAVKSSRGKNQKIQTILVTSKGIDSSEEFLRLADHRLLKSPSLPDEVRAIISDVLDKGFISFEENFNLIEKPKGKIERIHYIDDDEDLHFLVKQGLKGIEGAEIKLTGEPNEAVDSVTNFRPQIILLDYMMPDLDGPAVFRALRQNGVNCPIYFMTAKTKESELSELKALGAQGVVPKPFNPKKLKDTLNKIWNEFNR